MRILKPLRPDITGDKLDELSLAAATVNIGNALVDRGHQVDYIGNVDHPWVRPSSKVYRVDPGSKDQTVAALAFLLYREEGYDILDFHAQYFSGLAHYDMYMADRDNVVFTLGPPCNIGRTFYYYHEPLRRLLRHPQFRLVCESNVGSRDPLMRALGDLDESKVLTIHSGVVDEKVDPVPFDQKIPRAMTVGHLFPNKQILRTLEWAVKYRIHLLLVGRRFPYRSGDKVPPEFDEYAVKCLDMIARNADLIQHVDFMPHRDLMVEMARSRALVVYSDIESYGFTPVEAAMVGTPTIWIGGTGIDDTMSEVLGGLRIDRREYRTWEKRLERGAQLFQELGRLDQLAQPVLIQRTTERYSIQACAQKYETLFQEILAPA